MDVEMAEEKKLASLSYLQELIKDEDPGKELLEKVEQNLKKHNIYLNQDPTISFNSLLLTYSDQLKSVIGDVYLIPENFESFKSKLPQKYNYKQHFDYWREPCFNLDEKSCQQGKGICQFEIDVLKIIRHGFRLRQFEFGPKCIYCRFLTISNLFKYHLILEAPNTEITILNPYVRYHVDLPNEYPSQYMLTQYEKPGFYGVLGEFPDVNINQLEYFNHKIILKNGKTTICRGVKHHFFKNTNF